AELTSFFAAALDEAHPAPATSRHMRPRPAPAARVLCVDDNPLNRELVAASVAGAGFQVSFAENGAEAVEIIDRDGIDIVLLDLLMPVQDGAETLRLLRADPRHLFLPIIVLTAHGSGSMRQEAIVGGADDFIAYPVIGEEMVRPLLTLSAVLGMIRHHHERYDGRGYPDGLRGNDIPHEVRLLSIVDAYDALTSHRSYRPAPLSHTAALETLRREAAGGKWDPVMVDQFVGMLGANPPDWEAITQSVPSLYPS